MVNFDKYILTSTPTHLAEAAAAQLLDHPVLGAQLGQRPVKELHRDVVRSVSLTD